jgi:hypothetical protein
MPKGKPETKKKNGNIKFCQQAIDKKGQWRPGERQWFSEAFAMT